MAVIGPLGNDQHDMLGPWWEVGRAQDAVTLFDSIQAQEPSAALHPRSGRDHLAAGAQVARISARDPESGPGENGLVHARP
jgi:hypothetical protein